jgi:hypothetical protein
MKRAVSFDEKGRILVLFDPETKPDAKVRMKYVPKPGERHHHLEVPAGLEGKSNRELFDLLAVDVSNEKPALRLRKKA